MIVREPLSAHVPPKIMGRYVYYSTQVCHFLLHFDVWFDMRIKGLIEMCSCIYRLMPYLDIFPLPIFETIFIYPTPILLQAIYSSVFL